MTVKYIRDYLIQMIRQALKPLFTAALNYLRRPGRIRSDMYVLSLNVRRIAIADDMTK